MDFLDRFSAPDRARVVAAASTLTLARGELLLRRGEPGGDIYRVEDGELEVIDTRAQPAVILHVFGPGSVVGEMAFLDESPRSADVRAGAGAVCQRWERGALLRALDENPGLAASFYRVVAEMLSDRVKRTVTERIQDQAARPTQRGSAGVGAQLGQRLREALAQVEPALRRDRVTARSELLGKLGAFVGELDAVFSRLGDGDALAAGTALARELHPYLMRSTIGELVSAREASGGRAFARIGARAVTDHILGGRPEGDGPLGEILDEWLLSLPTARALRERASVVPGLVADRLGAVPLERALVLGARSPALVADLCGRLGPGGELALVDDDRDALTALDVALRQRDGGAPELRHAVTDLASLALGRSTLRFPGRQVVVVDGLVDYLPERAAALTLRWAAEQLAPGGVLVVTACLPNPDDAVFRHLLGWPLVRRGRGALQGLLAGVGLSSTRVYEAGTAGVVAMAGGAAPAARSAISP